MSPLTRRKAVAWFGPRRLTDEEYVARVRKSHAHLTRTRVIWTGLAGLSMILLVSVGGRFYHLLCALIGKDGTGFAAGFFVGLMFGPYLYATLTCLLLAWKGRLGNRTEELMLRYYDESRAAASTGAQ